MARVVIYLAWGGAFITQAAKSAVSARALGLPIYMITRAADAAQARSLGVFDEVIEGPFSGASLLDKAHLYDCVPDAFDTFLFLDTDTHVLADVSLGFDMATRYGIAMAIAPHYDIASYGSFGDYMDDKGIEKRGQTQFNTGVLFVNRTPAVANVFAIWRRLCAEAAKFPLRFTPDDQPYFSLALLEAGFAPYPLAPPFNYRAAGEPVFGPVRIWHNHVPPPADVNDDMLSQLARAFRGAVRVA